MIIEVRKLNALKKYTGEFEFVYNAPKDKLLLPFVEFEGDIKVKGVFEICEDDSVGVDFSIYYLLKGQCSYCLKPAQKSVEFYSEVLFVPEDDPDYYFYDGNRIDLAPAVNDAILFSQPDVLLCREDCEGININ